MWRPLAFGAILIVAWGPAATAQDAARAPLKPYGGTWIHVDTWDKGSACRHISQGGDDDGMLVIRETSFRSYLPQSPCRITKSDIRSPNSVAIEAMCGNRLVKETWRLNGEFLERSYAGSTRKYVRCKPER